MAKTNTTPAPEQEAKTTPAQEPDINEADGEPIFHADEEEGEDNE